MDKGRLGGDPCSGGNLLWLQFRGEFGHLEVERTRGLHIPGKADRQKPIIRSVHDPVVSYLILGHGHFMLRNEYALQWKSEDQANKFEMLVTSGHDRVFGDMVRQQQMADRKKKEDEYRKRKMLEKKKAEEEEKQKKEEGGARADDKKDGALKVDEPASPTSVRKVKDGEEVKPKLEEKETQSRAVAPGGAVAVLGKDDKVVVALPVKDGVQLDGDAKHEAEARLAAPGDAAKAKEEETKEARKEGENDDKERKKVDQGATKSKGKADALFNPEMLAKMIGGNPANMDMEDIQLAFRALEAAAAETGMPLPPLPGLTGGGGPSGLDKKDTGPLIWTWGDKTVGIYKPGTCEKWRWRNWEAGCAVFPPGGGGAGGWEERDWKVFADDRGVAEFEEDQQEAEVTERDIHDWNC